MRINGNHCEDLPLVFELESSLITAEATIISALERKESRGAHQRSDFPEINSLCKFNSVVSFDKTNKELKINKIPLKKLKNELKKLISVSKKEENIKNKLLE